ncbi:tetratricopeptide repeat protein [Herbaspirillum sp. HC18]|nr:tetratricopeptide repeat protein [Herbaspirillum sp. HC18]
MTDFSFSSVVHVLRSGLSHAKRKSIETARMAPYLHLALAAALLTVAPAHAESASPAAAASISTSLNGIAPADLAAYPEVRAQIEQGRFANALAALRAKESQHGDDASYYNLLGILALKVGDFPGAVTAFERVVLMQPDNAGAWLDLAIASAETGNLSGATAYFDYIEERFSPPPAVRMIISRYRARLAARPEVSPWQVQLDAMFGVDSNANSGLQSSAIPLTFGAERVDLVLDPSFHARADRFVQAGVVAVYRQPLGNSIGEIAMGVRTRDYLHEKNFSTFSANLGAGIHRATYVGDAAAWLHLENLWLGGNPLMRNVRAVVQLERPYETCRLGLSAEAEWRRYTTQNILDANLIWGQAGVACDWRIAQVPVQTILIGRTGFDDPTGDRAGGETLHNELIAQIGMPIAWGALAELSMTWANARDKEGYSPLLEQNAARHLDRRTLRLLVTVPLTSSSDVQILAEDNRFKSNLALFQQTGQTLSVGFRHRF